MIKPIPPIAILLACVALVACGDDEDEPSPPIPGDRVAALQQQLDSIESRFEAGGAACADITTGDDTNTAVVNQVLDSIPKRVHADVRSALRESFDRLFELVERECEEPETETETTETVPPPETTETRTVTTETTPTVTTPTETVPPETRERPRPRPPEQPPGQQNGGQQGGGVGPPDEEGDG